jgi:hypothetical protein
MLVGQWVNTRHASSHSRLEGFSVGGTRHFKSNKFSSQNKLPVCLVCDFCPQSASFKRILSPCYYRLVDKALVDSFLHRFKACSLCGPISVTITWTGATRKTKGGSLLPTQWCVFACIPYRCLSLHVWSVAYARMLHTLQRIRLQSPSTSGMCSFCGAGGFSCTHDGLKPSR